MLFYIQYILTWQHPLIKHLTQSGIITHENCLWSNTIVSKPMNVMDILKCKQNKTAAKFNISENNAVLQYLGSFCVVAHQAKWHYHFKLCCRVLHYISRLALLYFIFMDDYNDPLNLLFMFHKSHLSLSLLWQEMKLCVYCWQDSILCMAWVRSCRVRAFGQITVHILFLRQFSKSIYFQWIPSTPSATIIKV